MSAFTRIAMFAVFVLSLSFLVSALPTSVNKGLDARSADISALLQICADLDANVRVELQKLHIKAHLAALVAVIEIAIAAIIKLGVLANVDLSIKAEIVAKIAATITAVVALCLDLQICLQTLLVKLDVCLGSVLALVLKAIIDVNVLVFIKAHLCLFGGLFAILGL